MWAPPLLGGGLTCLADRQWFACKYAASAPRVEIGVHGATRTLSVGTKILRHPHLALHLGIEVGRARQFFSGVSDVYLLGNLNGVVYLNNEVSNGALDLCAQEAAGQRVDCRSDGRSRWPWSAAASTLRTSVRRGRCSQPIHAQSAHTVWSSGHCRGLISLRKGIALAAARLPAGSRQLLGGIALSSRSARAGQSSSVEPWLGQTHSR